MSQIVTVEVPGPPGANAYQLAVRNGYSGTEMEWLAFLTGSASSENNTLVRRDETGNFFVNDPTHVFHPANQRYVDGIGSENPFVPGVVRRDSQGFIGGTRIYAETGPPTAPHELTRKDYVDGIGTWADGPDTVARRNEFGQVAFESVFLSGGSNDPSAATRKDYVDNIGTHLSVAGTIARRSGDGGLRAAWGEYGTIYIADTVPKTANEAVRKDYVDNIGTPANVPDTIVRRDINGGVSIGSAYVNDAQANFPNALARKDYVDSRTQKHLFMAIRGSGDGAAVEWSAGAEFKNVPLNTISIDTFARGGFDAATGIYTIPITGVWDVNAFIRITDGQTSTPAGYGVGVDAVGTNDGPTFAWMTPQSVPGERATLIYTRNAYFTAGQQVRLFTYVDSGTLVNFASASLTVALMHAF